MSITPQELTLMTKKALKKAERAKAAAAEQQRAEAENQRQIEETKAQGIIQQIPHRAKTEAGQGRSHATIMSVHNKDYQRPPLDNQHDRCKPEWLIGSCKIVYDYCKKAGLEPTIEYWHDGVGINSGFNIVIHWPNE